MAVEAIYFKAVNLARYSVPGGVVVVVSEGLCMVTTRHFQVRGLLVVNGVVRLGAL